MKIIHVLPLTGHKSMIVFGSVILNFFDNNQGVLGGDHEFIFEYSPESGHKELLIDKLNPGVIKKVKFLMKADVTRDIFSQEQSHVYFHQLPSVYVRVIFLLMFMIKRKIKYSWVIWGGDLYNNWNVVEGGNKKTLIEGLKLKAKKMIDTFFVKKMCYVCSVSDDLSVFDMMYPNSSARHKIFYYPNNMLSSVSHVTKPAHKDKKILISHSASMSNNHLEVINLISHLKDQEVIVVAVLSYGASEQYIDMVIAEGKRVFGEKFVPILDFMSENEYMEFLNTINIAIILPDRQAGIWTTITMIAAGVKVYYKSTSSPYEWYKGLGLKIYDALTIQSVSNNDILNIDKVVLSRNISIVKEVYSNDIMVSMFKSTFTD